MQTILIVILICSVQFFTPGQIFAAADPLPCGVYRALNPEKCELISLKINITSNGNYFTLSAKHQIKFSESDRDSLSVILPIPEYGRESIRFDSCNEAIAVEPFPQENPAQYEGVQFYAEGGHLRGELKARAFSSGRDVTSLLEELGIQIESLGLWRPFRLGEAATSQLDTLPLESRNILIDAGLAIRENPKNDANNQLLPNWTVKKYYLVDLSGLNLPNDSIGVSYNPVMGSRELNRPEEVFEIFPDLSTEENKAELKRNSPSPKAMALLKRPAVLRWITVILPLPGDWRTSPVNGIEFVIMPGTGEAVLFPGSLKPERSVSGYRLIKPSVGFKEFTVYFLKQ